MCSVWYAYRLTYIITHSSDACHVFDLCRVHTHTYTHVDGISQPPPFTPMVFPIFFVFLVFVSLFHFVFEMLTLYLQPHFFPHLIHVSSVFLRIHPLFRFCFDITHNEKHTLLRMTIRLYLYPTCINSTI